MCGLVGYLALQEGEIDLGLGKELVDAMARRGPDDEGIWCDHVHCFLGFRRLSILDLSDHAHQPIVSSDGRHVLVFNGEVYNFRELRHQLEQHGHRFRSTGDAEVVLYSLVEWGTEALERFNGMFALALYSTEENRLLLARDHAGIKPLYYLLDSSKGLVFASQFKQILAHPWSAAQSLSREGLGLYLRLGFIPSGYSILEGASMLQPGTWLELDSGGVLRRGRFFEFPKWQTPELRGQEAFDAIDAAVTAAVERQLVSDVPVGVFLSGGIDSPLVAAKIAELGQSSVKAFTIGLRGSASDEASDAVKYSRRLALQHTVRYFADDDVLQLLDDVVDAYSEPFGDYSAFPTMLVSRSAHRQVKVMLGGDGGDELFWGYAGRFSSVLSLAPAFRQPHWKRSVQWWAHRFVGWGNSSWNLRFPTIGDWYRAKHTHIPESWLARVFPEGPEWPQAYNAFSFDGSSLNETAQWLRWNEYQAHLAMVLMKVDGASMHESLEVRVPLLDREVVMVAARVDWESCLDLETGLGKLPLRKSLQSHVGWQTEEKKGFWVPMGDWLRGPLKGLFEERVLSRNDLAGVPIDSSSLGDLWRSHQQGEDFAWGLWILLSLALWEGHHLDARSHLG